MFFYFLGTSKNNKCMSGIEKKPNPAHISSDLGPALFGFRIEHRQRCGYLEKETDSGKVLCYTPVFYTLEQNVVSSGLHQYTVHTLSLPCSLFCILSCILIKKTP